MGHHVIGDFERKNALRNPMLEIKYEMRRTVGKI
jgi:hypothetical protein